MLQHYEKLEILVIYMLALDSQYLTVSFSFVERSKTGIAVNHFKSVVPSHFSGSHKCSPKHQIHQLVYYVSSCIKHHFQVNFSELLSWVPLIKSQYELQSLYQFKLSQFYQIWLSLFKYKYNTLKSLRFGYFKAIFVFFILFYRIPPNEMIKQTETFF